MKNNVLTLIAIFFITFIYAQKVDMVSAPRNPIGFKHKKEHFFLKGDIYASVGKIFDRNGNLTYNYGTRYFYENGKITSNNYGDTIKYDANGNVILFQYNSGSTNNYSFNSKNLLIAEDNTYGDHKTYTYDSQDRLVKTILNRKGIFNQQRDYKYEKSGDSVIVKTQYTNEDRQLGFKGTYFYLNGHLVKEVLVSNTHHYVVERDAKGNKINFYTANDPNAKHIETYNRYYSDANKKQNIEYGYYIPGSDKTAKKIPAIYVNSIRVTDIEISKGLKENEKVIYDGLTETYYTLENLVDDNNTINTRIKVTNVMSNGKPHLSYVYNGSFINYVYGKNKVKAREFAFIGTHMLDYRIENNIGRTYVIENYKNKAENPIKEMKFLTADTSSIIYTRELEKDNFFIVVKGKHIEYKKARFEYLSSGDPVIFIDEVPLYILTGFKDAKDLEIKIGKKYNNELVLEENNAVEQVISEVKKTSPSKEFNCVTGDCKNGWGRVTVNDIITDATFKDNAINGLAYISYPNGGYFHGQYVNNRRSGVGYYKWDNGSVYIGGWKEGKQHGLGYTMNSKNEITTAGTFENGNLIEDVSKDYNSGKTSGNCKGNCVNGFGKYSYSNGDKYWGFFKDGNRFGIGTYLWNNKSAFTGTYTTGGKRNGYGIYTYVDGSVFKGIFIDDKIDGLGVMKYAKSGDISQGVFNNKGAKVKDF